MPGLVAAVGRGDDIEVVVLGDQSLDGSPMAQDSLFRIASITKPMTAALALTFVADGTVTLEQPVDDLLPELASPVVVRSLTGPVDETVPAARAITVRQLLTSTNGHGFPSDFSAPVVQLLFDRLHQGPPQPQRVPPPDEWMAILADIPLLHQPGEGFTYNTAFDILGVLVARAGGTAAARPDGDADPRAARDGRHRASPSRQAPTTDARPTTATAVTDWSTSMVPTGSGRRCRPSHRVPAAWCRRWPTCSRSNGCCSPVAETSCPPRW